MYRLDELLNLNRVNIRKLNSTLLVDFYLYYLESNVYIFNLSNNDTIKLIFDKENFFHLIGFHNFFNYKGLPGWNFITKNPKDLKDLDFNKNKKTKLTLNRIKYFNMLPNLLENPNIYFFQSIDFPYLNYKAKYFAVMKHNNRFLKLGIVESNNNLHYPETYLVDTANPDYNKYIDPKYRIDIFSSKSVNKRDFLHNYNDLLKTNKQISVTKE